MVGWVPGSFAQNMELRDRMEYKNRNQTDYWPLVVRGVGRAVDPDGVPVPGVCLGLFAERGIDWWPLAQRLFKQAKSASRRDASLELISVPPRNGEPRRPPKRSLD